MANIFVERENASLRVPASKMRQRIQSAPENMLGLTAKKVHTPLPSGRKALGAVNKMTSTPARNGQEKKLQKAQEAKVKCVPQNKVEEYPDIENFSPYDPLEFEKYFIPEDMVHISGLALPGLIFPQTPRPSDQDFEMLEASTPLSPLKMPRRSEYRAAELDAFLQTIDELTIDLPPESD
ncbi:securin [Diretmus argenteus]